MSAVREEDLVAYFRRFHQTYVETVETHVPEEYQQRLVRYSLLPRCVGAYISTMNGVGYEYLPPEMGEFVVVRKGSARAEHLLVGDLYSPSSVPKHMVAFSPRGDFGLANVWIDFPPPDDQAPVFDGAVDQRQR